MKGFLFGLLVATVLLPSSATASDRCKGVDIDDYNHVITRLAFARDLHTDWAKEVVIHPDLAPTVGDQNWHLGWVADYNDSLSVLSRLGSACGLY